MEKDNQYRVSDKLISELLEEIHKYGDAVAKREDPERIEQIKNRKDEIVKQLKELWTDHELKLNGQSDLNNFQTKK